MGSWRVAGSECLEIVAQRVDDGTTCPISSAQTMPLGIDQDDGFLGYIDRGEYVMEAWAKAKREYTSDAVVRYAGSKFREMIEGLLPNFLSAFGSFLKSDAIGAAVGAGTGALNAGVGAEPGSLAGAKFGSLVVGWNLNWLGINFLYPYVGAPLERVGVHVSRGLQMAWNSCGHEPTLNAAAKQLGEGVGVFFALLMEALIKYAGEVGVTRAKHHLHRAKWGFILARYIVEDKEAQQRIKVQYWLNKLGIPNKPQLVRERLGTAIRFLEQVYPEHKILGYLKGIDFSMPVKLERLTAPPQLPAVGETVSSFSYPRSVLVQFYHADYGISNFFTRMRGGAPLTRLGVDKGTREMRFYVLRRSVTALESHASPIKDTWTSPGRVKVSVPKRAPGTGKISGYETRYVDKSAYVGGGGKQLILPVPDDPGQLLVELNLAE